MSMRLGSRHSARPAPDEVDLAADERLPDGARTPQPERAEPRLRDPEPTDLSLRDYAAIGRRAGRAFLDDNMTMIASALAYSAFLAIPSVLLVAIGLFTLLA